jgi:transposase-like protein
MLDDLTSRGLARPDLVIVEGGNGLETALAGLWDDVPVQLNALQLRRKIRAALTDA